ncbi:MAG: hypothetical protein K6E51_03150 [Treponema sp.]|nr:hypothetical protein [Treponema sp.]
MQRTKVIHLHIFFSILLLLFTLSSIYYKVHESYHECSGEDCPICYVIAISERNIQLLSFAFSFIILVSFFLSSNKIQTKQLGIAVFKAQTLVSQKIRLND